MEIETSRLNEGSDHLRDQRRKSASRARAVRLPIASMTSLFRATPATSFFIAGGYTSGRPAVVVTSLSIVQYVRLTG